MLINDILIKHKNILKKYNNLDINQLNITLFNFIWEIKNKNKIYEIEKIIKKKNTKNGIKYYVKWKGFNNKYNSWINHDNFI